MRIGILGATGPAGRSLAARLAAVGYDVVIGSRAIERAERTRSELLERWPDRRLSLTAAENEGAAAAEVVVVATPWEGAADTARSLSHHLGGKVVISIANALARADGEFQPLVLPRGSVAAGVQAAAPDAKVAAALHHVPARDLGALDHDIDLDVLVCSDHDDALRATIEIVERIPGCRGLDAGRLSAAAAIEAFTAVVLQLNVRYKTRAGVRLTGIDTP